MTSFIEAKKAEARKAFWNLEQQEPEDYDRFLDDLLESFLSEIEGRVVPKIPMAEIFSTKPYGNSTLELVEKAKEIAVLKGKLDARDEIKAAFQHLRTGGTE